MTFRNRLAQAVPPTAVPAGECVGIAFQSLKNEDTENISYIIPTPVIEHFINGGAPGSRGGSPAAGLGPSCYAASAVARLPRCRWRRRRGRGHWLHSSPRIVRPASHCTCLSSSRLPAPVQITSATVGTPGFRPWGWSGRRWRAPCCGRRWACRHGGIWEGDYAERGRRSACHAFKGSCAVLLAKLPTCQTSVLYPLACKRAATPGPAAPCRSRTARCKPCNSCVSSPLLQPGQRGVLVRRIEPTSPVSEVLKQGDIILRWGWAVWAGGWVRGCGGAMKHPAHCPLALGPLMAAGMVRTPVGRRLQAVWATATGLDAIGPAHPVGV